ncbi:unnamed protein product [Brassica oleracea]|uniref:LOW QUALITY PROTEIN: transcription factor MYB108 n=1 Tax=Brassica oleracea var. oleracea TaxID=109376 RepID=UPI0006A6E1D1|nr:PREDICTED: LOW QUALITY PROTEIN: transcription factor MYB108 [Brassica oleracea var. oleracea]
MDGKRSFEINKNMGDFENNVDDEMDLRRGPWTVEEDFKLSNYISTLGEGRWNSLARCAGLKRTGKSCRLRWLNYLRPDIRRGNITLEEQLLILELHSRWGNRWSKIAQYLPGRTDNEIKNYWRTRVQKHAKQLRCDVNSQQFKDTMRYLWMPRLVERIQAASASSTTGSAAKFCVTTTTDQFVITSYDDGANNNNTSIDHLGLTNNPNGYVTSGTSSVTVSPASGLTEYNIGSEVGKIITSFDPDQSLVGPQILLPSQNYLDDKSGLLNGGLGDMQEQSYPNLFENINGMIPSYSDSFWNIGSDEDFWLLQQQQQQQQLLNNRSF